MYHCSMRYFILILSICYIGCTYRQSDIDEKKHFTKRPSIAKRICNKAPAIVAVIDTGLKLNDQSRKVKLCKTGHKNFSDNGLMQFTHLSKDPVPFDAHGHGTNVAGLIHKYAGDASYCIVIIKYFDGKLQRENALANTILAIKHAMEIGAKYINYSGGGTAFSYSEQKAVKEFLDKGGIFVASAGNNRQDIEKVPYYPASDDPRTISVGSIEEDGTRSGYSNWGTSIDKWDLGSNQVGFGVSMSGTSQATAVVTGKIINKSECEK